MQADPRNGRYYMKEDRLGQILCKACALPASSSEARALRDWQHPSAGPGAGRFASVVEEVFARCAHLVSVLEVVHEVLLRWSCATCCADPAELPRSPRDTLTDDSGCQEQLLMALAETQVSLQAGFNTLTLPKQ